MPKSFILLYLPAVLAAWASSSVAADPVPPSDPAAIEAYRRLPYCKLAPDGKHLLKEPCRRPPTRSFEQRRAAQAEAAKVGPPGRQALEQLEQEQQAERRLPPPSSTLPMPVAAAPPRAPAVPPPVPAPAVQPLNQCDVAGCRGANGALYQQGAGNILLDPSGRLCTRNGLSVQCQ
jgi:hypothetical protein